MTYLSNLSSKPPTLSAQEYVRRAIAKASSASAAHGEGGAGGVGFSEFKPRLYRRYQHARHLQLIDETLAQVIRYVETGGREGIGYLIIEWAPRHGKSFSLGRMFPAYVVGGHPDWRVIYASYAAHLAHKFSRQARNLLLSDAYRDCFPGIFLADDNRAADSWSVRDHDGGMDAMGVGGGVTGKGGQILIGDDLISGRADAESPVIRNRVWDWFTDDFYTRREPGGAIILSGTRWHEDDPIGRALRTEPGKWRRLRLPALAEENDPLGRAVGEPLWADRFPLDVLEDIQRTLGAYSWAALYQQRPAPREGGLFKWKDIHENRRDDKPILKRIVVAIDPAVTSGVDSDETGVVVAGLSEDGHGYVLADASLRASPDGWARQAITSYRTWKADRIVVEVNNGGDLCEHTLKTVDRNVPVTQLHASRGKVTRAEPIAALYEQGKVHHVGTFGALEDQMCQTLDGANSPDRVDALVWALTELMLPSGRNMWSDVW